MKRGERLLQQVTPTNGSSPTTTANGSAAAGGTTTTPGNPTPEGPITEGPVYERLLYEATGATDWLLDTLNGWLPTDIANLLVTVIVLGTAWYSAKAVTRLLEDRIHERFERPSVARTVLRSIRMVILGVGVILVLITVFNVKGADLTVSVAAFSAMVGVVLAPIVGSLVSGLFVLADQPYEVGDMIEIVDTGQMGYVQDITIRYTKIRTIDNTFLVIPNGSMRERDVRNLTADDDRTRIALSIGVTYESDVDDARSVIERAVGDVDGIISGGPPIRVGPTRYPAGPTCLIDGFGPNSVDLQLHVWIDNPQRHNHVESAVLERVYHTISEHESVAFAYPHTHLVFDETSGTMNVTQSKRSMNESNENRLL